MGPPRVRPIPYSLLRGVFHPRLPWGLSPQGRPYRENCHPYPPVYKTHVFRQVHANKPMKLQLATDIRIVHGVSRTDQGARATLAEDQVCCGSCVNTQQRRRAAARWLPEFTNFKVEQRQYGGLQHIWAGGNFLSHVLALLFVC